MKKPKRIGVGDAVRIVTPEVFIRCGYPLVPTSEEAVQFAKQFEPQLFEIMEKSLGVSPQIARNVTFAELKGNKAIKRFLKEMAYLYCAHRKFGGNERKIYTENKPELKTDKVYTVRSVKSCYTGTYVSGSTWGNEWGEPEYDPPYLDKPTFHHILYLGPRTDDRWISDKDMFSIEDIYVQKVT